MSEKVVAKLSALIGFKVDDKGLKKFKLGLAAASAVLIKFTNDTVKAVIQLDNFNKRTGISEEFAYGFMNMAKIANISTESVVSGLEAISQARQDILRGEGNIQPWALLGVDITQKPEKVFDDILKKIKEINDPALRSKLLSDAGLDAQLANLANVDMSGVATNLFMKDEDRKGVKELGSELSKLMLNLSLLKDKFISLATPIRWVFELFNRLIFAFSNIIEKTIGFSKFTKILTTIIIGLVSIFSPLTTIIFAIALAIDDFLTYLDGGQSIIGTFINKLKELLGEDGFKGLINILKIVGATLATVFVVNKINKFGGAFSSMVVTMKTAWLSLDAIFKKSPLGIAIMGGMLAIKGGKWIGEKVGTALGEKLDPEKVLDTWDSVKGGFKGFLSFFSGENKENIPLNIPSTIPSNTSNINNRNSNVTITNNMNITGNNAREIGETIKQKQQDLITDNTAMMYGY